MEGLKVALGRCDASRFRVVAALLLRGGWATDGACNGMEGEGRGKRAKAEKPRSQKGLQSYAAVGTKLQLGSASTCELGKKSSRSNSMPQISTACSECPRQSLQSSTCSSIYRRTARHTHISCYCTAEAAAEPGSGSGSHRVPPKH